MAIINVLLFQQEDLLYTSESDVHRRLKSISRYEGYNLYAGQIVLLLFIYIDNFNSTQLLHTIQIVLRSRSQRSRRKKYYLTPSHILNLNICL